MQTGQSVEEDFARERRVSMPFSPSRQRPGASRLRLQTLVRLRWLAVAGQTVAVVGVYAGLGFPLPMGPCLAVIALSAWLNIFLSVRYRANLRLRNRYAALLLAYDIVQLAVLLYFTGGLQNPFSFLFLVPTTVSASTLPLRRTLLIACLALGFITLLAFYHLPLPWSREAPLHLPHIYIVGMWAALVSGLIFNGIYAWRVAEETRRMSNALTATEMVLAREQQLSALDGLAAAAAHELGTPLATIALVAKELRHELPNAADYDEDLELLHSQAERCRTILSTLTQRDDEGDIAFARMKLTVMIEEIAAPLRTAGVTINVTREEKAEPEREPLLHRNPGVLYGLGNIVDNAADFAGDEVGVSLGWTDSTVTVTVEDDGPGFAQDIIDKLGEPYVTTRPSTGANRPADGSPEGMGLGFFIAKTLLERTGAGVTLANRPAPEHGAIVRIRWPRRDIDAGA